MAERFPGPVLDLLDAAGDRTVFEHAGREVSGAQLLGMVRRAAHGLRRRGVGPGDGVAMLLGVGPGAFAAILAAHVVGARVVGVRPGLTERQREHLLRDVDVRVTDRPDGAGSPGAGPVLALDELLSAPDDGVRPHVSARPGDVARLTKLVADQRASPADLGGLRALMVSGSPLEPGRLREAAEVLGPVVFHGYGQTETGMISMAGPDEPPGSLGVPPVDVEIRDPSGRPVPPGTDGELFVRTPSQSSGYWREPALTAEVFTGGWVRTRDLGRFDASGRLWLTGRVRDVIIVNANVYYAGPVERLLAGHPSVAEAYVVAVPDDATGEAVHAFVVPAHGHVPDLGELRALVTADLGEACAPTRLTVIGEVPLTAAGKPDKRRLVAGR